MIHLKKAPLRYGSTWKFEILLTGETWLTLYLCKVWGHFETQYGCYGQGCEFLYFELFLYFRPMIFLTFEWRKITKLCTQEWLTGFYLHAKSWEFISSRLGNITKKPLIFGEFWKTYRFKPILNPLLVAAERWKFYSR